MTSQSHPRLANIAELVPAFLVPAIHRKNTEQSQFTRDLADLKNEIHKMNLCLYISIIIL